MKARERLLCLLSGGIPDRVPISPFITEYFLASFYDHQHTDRVVDAVNVAETFDLDLITRQHITPDAYFMIHSAPNWDVSVKKEIKEGNLYRFTRIQTPVRELTMTEATPYHPWDLHGAHYSTTEYLIKDEGDYEAFKTYVPEMPQEERKYILESALWAQKVVGDRGISCPWTLGGVYNRATCYINMEDMLTDAYSDEEYYEEYMNFFTELVIKNHMIFAESVCDGIGYQGNIANAGIMGEEYFRKFVLPYEQRAIQVLRDVEKPVIYHNCGKAKGLYPAYKELGITVWETVSESPQGDNNLKEAKAYFGDDLILSGNFDQVHFLKEASPEEIEQAAAAMMEEGKQGGHYIFAASDYIEADTPVENLKAFLRGGLSRAWY